MELKQALVEGLEHTLKVLEKAHADATEAATHAEAKPENDKDTRALEQSYLARGQAIRVEAARQAVSEVKAMSLPSSRSVVLGSLVSAVEGEAKLRLFIAPHGGGTKLSGGVQVVTPSSPLGMALMGRKAGDVCELQMAGRLRELELDRVE